MENNDLTGNGLNERQKRFAELRLAQPFTPIAQLYLDAGYQPKNGNTANAAASRLLHNVKIIEYMHQLRRAVRTVGESVCWKLMASSMKLLDKKRQVFRYWRCDSGGPLSHTVWLAISCRELSGRSFCSRAVQHHVLLASGGVDTA